MNVISDLGRGVASNRVNGIQTKHSGMSGQTSSREMFDLLARVQVNGITLNMMQRLP